MTTVLKSTSLGNLQTMHTKIIQCSLVALLFAVLSFFPKLYILTKDYWFSNIGAPLLSLDNYQASIPIIMIMIGMLAVRIIASLSLMLIVLVISEKIGNTTTSIVVSVLALCLSPLLSLIGIPGVKWLSALPLFNFAVLMTNTNDTIGVCLYIVSWMLIGALCLLYLMNIYDSASTDK